MAKTDPDSIIVQPIDPKKVNNINIRRDSQMLTLIELLIRLSCRGKEHKLENRFVLSTKCLLIWMLLRWKSIHGLLIRKIRCSVSTLRSKLMIMPNSGNKD